MIEKYNRTFAFYGLSLLIPWVLWFIVAYLSHLPQQSPAILTIQQALSLAGLAAPLLVTLISVFFGHSPDQFYVSGNPSFTSSLFSPWVFLIAAASVLIRDREMFFNKEVLDNLPEKNPGRTVGQHGIYGIRATCSSLDDGTVEVFATGCLPPAARRDGGSLIIPLNSPPYIAAAGSPSVSDRAFFRFPQGGDLSPVSGCVGE